MVFQTISALLVVLALILLLRVLLRSMALGGVGAGRRSLRVLESVSLGSGQRLHVVEVEGERLLIGSTEGSVRTLHTLPAAEEVEDPEPRGPSHRVPRIPRVSWIPASKVWLRLMGRTALFAGLFLVLDAAGAAASEAGEAPRFNISVDGLAEPAQVSSSLKILGLMTILSMAPSILLMGTCFTRVIVVLMMLRQATGLHQLPPTQVLSGLALFTTYYAMAPLGAEINEQALQPYIAEEIDEVVALERADAPMRQFLLTHTRGGDLDLFVSLSKDDPPETLEDVSYAKLLPAFMISELRTAFEFGFMIFLPFLIIDIVIASMLISMGMIVLPPMMIALPFKIMLFVLLDGWNLVIRSLVSSIA